MNEDPAEPKPPIQWTDDLSVGNDAIDNDHKAFIELARLLNGINSDCDERTTVMDSALYMLEEYVAGHFLREEKAMRKIKFKHLAEHHHKHEMFRGKITELVKAYREGSASIVSELPSLVTKWLISHIANEDMKFKNCISNSVVDSRPLAFLALEAYDDEELEQSLQTRVVAVEARVVFSRVKALICEPRGTVRQAARLALNELGIMDIDEANTFAAANRACGEGNHQILIMNHDLEGNDGTCFIRQIRAMQLGGDPFILTALLLTSREEAIVRTAMNAGSDSVLLIPFSTGQLKDQLRAQVERRKPFIVTQDYIGPERRSEIRSDRTSATQIPVPNPVHASGMSVPHDQYEASKNQAIQTIAMARVKSLSGAIKYECNALTASIRDNKATSETSFRSLTKLVQIAEELSEKAISFMGMPATNIDAFRARCNEFRQRPESLRYNDIESLSTDGRNIASIFTSH